MEAGKPCESCVVTNDICLVPADEGVRHSCSKCHKGKKRCGARLNALNADDVDLPSLRQKQMITELIESVIGFEAPRERPADDMDVEMGNDDEESASSKSHYSRFKFLLPESQF